MIEFKNVSKHFGPTQVLHNIDLNIAQGEVVVIIGPSGSGKSTLLRCINKLEEITSGDLIVDGLKVNDPKVDERLIRQEAGMVFQQFYLFPHLTALENVMFGPLRVRGANKEEAEKLARELLAKVGLAERAHHYPSELSGGQQQRVAIARALAVKPKMMLFDEPTSALDPELRHEVLKVMQDLAEEGMTMVIVTHEIGFAEKVASRLIFIDKGRIAEDGDPQVLIKNPPSQRLQEFLQHVSYLSASLSPKGRHTRFLSFKIAQPPASILIFLLYFLTGGVMRWILFILFCLLGAPAHAVSIPGVTTTTTTDSTTEPAPEPDIEQKKRPMAHWRMCWIMTPRVKS